MEHPFEIGDIVEILPCPLGEIYDIVGKRAKVIGFISSPNITTAIKVEIGDSIFFLHPMELKKIKGGSYG